ncbi:hypothetical protein [Sediminitomix flava]|uniref:Uncharacterized protein n=1 Tax=Sediminitomix flava TaxID=379075 RepID=A0A315ZHA3_SEDFL|nr:hypothetical protein [Sediminitomix flava]PWJ44672.1 hypothetical protein BC781_1011043 [Sediminitomix flava]
MAKQQVDCKADQRGSKRWFWNILFYAFRVAQTCPFCNKKLEFSAKKKLAIDMLFGLVYGSFIVFFNQTLGYATMPVFVVGMALVLLLHVLVKQRWKSFDEERKNLPHWRR